MSVPSFLSYTPVPLTFGTSGLRGLVRDITDLEAYINVTGGLLALVEAGDIQAGSSIVLGGDLRPSTERIMRASARAALDAGFTIENAGRVPTPALILHCIATERAGVMVTGSHIPFDRNGIKMNKSVGEVLKADEAGISRAVERVRAVEYARTADASAFEATGMLKRSDPLPEVDPAAERRYVARYVEAFGRGSLAGASVLLYEHSAVGRDLVARILRELGAEVTPVGRAETFVPIDTENITDELLDRLDALVAAAEAVGARPQAIVSTDGDSDRPLVAAVLPSDLPIDKRGSGRRVQFLSGDLLGIVAATFLRAKAVAVPISANDAVEREMRRLDVAVAQTKIGSPYVVAAIDDLVAKDSLRIAVGWEANGGFLLGSAVSPAHGGAPLAPLPTRDAVLPIVANLLAARQAGISLPELWGRLPARFGKAGLLDDVSPVISRAILAHLAPSGGVVEVTVGPDGFVHDGHSAAGPAWNASVATLARFFTAADGFGPVERVNVLDGVRVTFAGGDVAHVRPSGNAPQLRIYSLADTQARADRIVELGLREPDGILRRLEKAFA